MPKVHKTVEDARANFESSASVIPDRYARGVERGSWADAASSAQAEANYATSVQKAISKKSRQAGCKKAGDAAWKEGAMTKGKAIIGQRVRDAAPKYAANFGSVYTNVLNDVDRLPARTTDFRENINSRLVGTVESWKKHSGKL